MNRLIGRGSWFRWVMHMNHYCPQTATQVIPLLAPGSGSVLGALLCESPSAEAPVRNSPALQQAAATIAGA